MIIIMKEKKINYSEQYYLIYINVRFMENVLVG